MKYWHQDKGDTRHRYLQSQKPKVRELLILAVVDETTEGWLVNASTEAKLFSDLESAKKYAMEVTP